MPLCAAAGEAAAGAGLPPCAGVRRDAAPRLAAAAFAFALDWPCPLFPCSRWWRPLDACFFAGRIEPSCV